MGVQKIKAIILRILPFKESSLIMHLFTDTSGRIQCLAKGIRRSKTKSLMVERGFLIELIVYNKPHRELHTATSIHVLNFYSEIRSNIVKSALRDVALETIYRTITQSESHRDLFHMLEKFLNYLHNSSEEKINPSILWLFYHRFAQLMGFGLNLNSCMVCNASFTKTAYLMINKGGLLCDLCYQEKEIGQNLPVVVLTYLTTGSPKPEEITKFLNNSTIKRITHLLSDYCRYHFDVTHEYKSLLFLNELL